MPPVGRTAPDAAGLPEAEEHVLTASDGEKVIVWHVPAKPGKPVVLFFHGNGEVLAWRVPRFRAITVDGTGLVALSFRGYGGSSGKPTEDGLLNDGAAAYAFAAKHYPPERIVPWGYSLGTGVAVAIGIGGPGATFWMILAGLLGMASKFTECTLGVKYRNEYEDGHVSGGPMYYMTKGFSERGVGGGKVLAVLFSIFCILGAFGGGNMFQSNQAHAQLANVFGDYPGWITGLVFALIVFMVIVGGIKAIAQVTERVVPFMGILYVGTALIIILLNYDQIGNAFGQIFRGAFTWDGAVGGATGALIQGFRRAAFSNEAGVGSAAIAHSAVRTNEPITEGFVSLLEPFIDTVVICTMTALVIIITGQLVTDPQTGMFVLNESGDAIQTLSGNSGVALTSAAFSESFGWFRYILALAVVLFAFSTMISWSYYGLKAWTFLFGEGRTKELVFKVIFCIFTWIGAAASLGPVIDFSDAMIFSMAVVNIIALYVLMPVVKTEMNSYLSRLRSGEIRKFA
ncbi:MAG: amino acid carrier protein [Paracoccus sp. (in: a-proteobacteria)]